MPRLKVDAVQRWMVRANIQTKFALAQISGISYGRLREILEERQDQVDEKIVAGLCKALSCRPEDIAAEGGLRSRMSHADVQ